jgi:AcrR family transcriptional regulator
VPFPARIDPEQLGAQTLAVIEDRSWEAWSLRDVAKELGVSANALYGHVGGRDELLVAAGEAATRELARALRRARGRGVDRLVSMANAYVRFAVRRPHAYGAFAYAKPNPDHPRIGAWLELWAHVRAQVETMLPDAADAAAFAFWALTHGRAELARGPARMAGPTMGLDVAVRALVLGFEQLGTVDSPLPDYIRSVSVRDP